MKIETDDLDRLEDDELTVTQLRKRIRMLRQKLSEKTDEQKAEESDAQERDREEMADLHDEKKTKSQPYEDEGDAIPTEDPEENGDDKQPKKKDD